MPPESADSGRTGGADAARGTIPSRADGRSLRIWTWGIFGLALILRLLALYGLRHAPSFQVLVLDAQGYHERALQLLQGIPAPGLFWQPALYPAFLALVYDLVGAHPLAARVLQALIGSLTACLTLRLGHRVFGLRTGIAAGVVVAAWAPLMLYELDLVADGVSAVWSVALILLFLEVRDRRRGRDALLWGACGALAILTRPTYLPFVACAGAWLAWAGRRGRDRRVPVLLLVGFALVWGPASAFSHRLAGRISPLPFSGGMNLWIGNNPDPCATLNVRPGRGWKRLETEPQRAGRVKPSERNAYFRERVLEYAAADPVSFATGDGGKSRPVHQLAGAAAQ
jgi:hypothetical protein